MIESKLQKVIEIIKELGILRPRDLKQYGIRKEYLWHLWKRGILERIGRGLYRIPGAPITEHHTLAEAAKRVPNGVVCLLSALQFHGITTQAPYQIWMAIDRKARRPRDDYPALRIVRFSGPAFMEGREIHNIDDVDVPIYSPAKTVADCFKYRNKVGLDVALEALRECWRRRLCTMDDLWRYAKICRVQKVMRPYMESLV